MEFLSVSLDFLSTHVGAVLGCVVLNIILGMTWYGPLFGKPWAAANGIDLTHKPPMKAMAEPFITSVISGAVLATILGGVFAYLVPLSLSEAMIIATLLWLGFVATSILTNYAWAGKSRTLRMIDVFFALVLVNVFAVILYIFG